MAAARAILAVAGLFAAYRGTEAIRHAREMVVLHEEARRLHATGRKIRRAPLEGEQRAEQSGPGMDREAGIEQRGALGADAAAEAASEAKGSGLGGSDGYGAPRDDFSPADPQSSSPPAEPEAEGAPVGAGEPVCADKAGGRRVVSVADQHGDFDSMVLHLQKLGIVRAAVDRRDVTWDGSWAGGDTMFIQVGDVIGLGPDGELMYKFLWKLQDEAAKSDGEVVLLLGDHELMALQGDMGFASSHDFCHYTADAPSCLAKPPEPCKPHAELDGQRCCGYDGGCEADPAACVPGNCEFLRSWDKDGVLGRELRARFQSDKMKVAHKVNGVVFAHAGLVPTLWQKLGPPGPEGAEEAAEPGAAAVRRLNDEAKRLFHPGASGESLMKSTSVVAGGERENGPLRTRICEPAWYDVVIRRENGTRTDEYQHLDKDTERGLANVGLHRRCDVVMKSLEVVGAERMVIGHCPLGRRKRGGMLSDGIEQDCWGPLVLTHTAMSSALSGSARSSLHNMAALEFFAGDAEQRVWEVRVGSHDLRDRCRQLADKGRLAGVRANWKERDTLKAKMRAMLRSLDCTPCIEGLVKLLGEQGRKQMRFKAQPPRGRAGTEPGH